MAKFYVQDAPFYEVQDGDGRLVRYDGHVRAVKADGTVVKSRTDDAEYDLKSMRKGNSNATR